MKQIKFFFECLGRYTEMKYAYKNNLEKLRAELGNNPLIDLVVTNVILFVIAMALFFIIGFMM